MIPKRAASSNSFADLELEIQAPWRLLTALAVWLLTLVVNLWAVDELHRLRGAVTVAVVAAAWFGLSQVAAGVAPAAVTRAVWLADGAWRLRDRRGREWAATLGSVSRQWGPVAVLVWRAGTRRWWAILTPATLGTDQYRRLSVRLRLGRHA